MTSARTAVLATAMVALGLAVGACGAEEPSPLSEGARDRILRGYELIESADGLSSTYGIVATEGDTEIASSCVSVTREPRSVAPDRQELHMGSFIENAKMCAPDTSFTIDGTTVYVATDELPPGRRWWIHNWAEVAEDVITEVSKADEQAEVRYRALLDAASNATENSSSISFDVSREALIESGLMKAEEVDDSAEAKAEFRFALDGGGLEEIHFAVTSDGATVNTWYLFTRVNEPQNITIPKAPFLNPKSKPIKTVEQFNAFVGIT